MLALIVWNVSNFFLVQYWDIFQYVLHDWQSGSSFVLGFFFRILPNLDLSLVYNLSFWGLWRPPPLLNVLKNILFTHSSTPGWWWWSKHEAHATIITKRGWAATASEHGDQIKIASLDIVNWIGWKTGCPSKFSLFFSSN